MSFRASVLLVVIAMLGALFSWSVDAAANMLGADPLVRLGGLVASDAPIPLGPAAISGPTVVAPGSAYIDGRSQDVLYVFTQPAAGWSGAPKPVAMLVDSAGRGLGPSAAISGQVIVATAGNEADVFTQPPGGWLGTVRESARLSASDAGKFGGLNTVAIDGPTIVAGSSKSRLSNSPGEAYVFAEPARGWSGNLRESARLFASRGQDANSFGWQVAISGQTIAVAAPFADFGPTHPSGGGRVYVFTAPVGGWSGTQHERATLSASDSSVNLAPPSSSSVALSGNNVFVLAAAPGAIGEVYVFSAAAGGWSGATHETAVLSSSDHSLSSLATLAASGATLVAGAFVFTEPAGGWRNATENAKLDPGENRGLGSLAISGQTIVGGTDTGSVFVEPSGGWSGTVDSAATLAVTGPSGQMLFASAGLSGETAVAGAPGASVGSNQNQGAVYVFTEPPRGWSSQVATAKLVESDGHPADSFGGLAAISGDTIVASRDTRRGLVLYVFTKPAAGWSGTLREGAQLTVSDPLAGGLQSLAMSGDTIVIGARGTCGCNPVGYVFTRPAGGWSGTLHESATLTVPNGSFPCLFGQDSISIDGPTIAVACSGQADVFTKPAFGWTGTIQPSATLVTPASILVESVVVLTSSIVAAGSSRGEPGRAANPIVFNEPANGWSGTIRPGASLTVSGSAESFSELVVGSGDRVAALVIPQSDQGCGILPTCSGTLYAFTKPPGGWRGAVSGPRAGVELATGYPLAIDERTIATGGADSISVFTARRGPPFARRAALSGVASGHPSLRFTLHAGQDAAAIRSFKLNLPHGLRLSTQRSGRRNGLHISAPHQSTTLRPHTLTVSLRHPVQSLSVTIVSPELTEERSLIGRLRRIRAYNQTYRAKHALTLHIRCEVTDATIHTTGLVLKFVVS